MGGGGQNTNDWIHKLKFSSVLHLYSFSLFFHFFFLSSPHTPFFFCFFLFQCFSLSVCRNANDFQEWEFSFFLSFFLSFFPELCLSICLPPLLSFKIDNVGMISRKWIFFISTFLLVVSFSILSFFHSFFFFLSFFLTFCQFFFHSTFIFVRFPSIFL